MKAVLGFLLIGGGLGGIYLVFSGHLQSLVAPVTNAGISNNPADIPSQKGSGGMSMRSSWNNLGSALAYQSNDRHASRGGM